MRVRSLKLVDFKRFHDLTIDLTDRSTKLVALVGPNGSGKSNFVDSLAFVQQCISDSIELAFKARGGIGSVRRRFPRHSRCRLKRGDATIQHDEFLGMRADGDGAIGAARRRE